MTSIMYSDQKKSGNKLLIEFDKPKVNKTNGDNFLIDEPKPKKEILQPTIKKIQKGKKLF